MPLRFAVLYGSVRTERQGIKAARFIMDQLLRRGHEPTLVDPLEVRLPLLDRMYKEYPKGVVTQFETATSFGRLVSRA